MRADVIFNRLDNLSRSFVFLDEAFNFIDSQTAQGALKLRAYAAGEGGHARTSDSKHYQKQRSCRKVHVKLDQV
jgi:hypothetical protein